MLTILMLGVHDIPNTTVPWKNEKIEMAAENVVGISSDICYSLLTIYAFKRLHSMHDNTKYTASSS